MIECTNNKIWYIKHKKKRIRKKIFRIAILLIALALCYSYYQNFIVNTVYNFCKDSCEKIATESVNKTVFMLSNLDANYQDLMLVEKNNNGDITYIKANSQKINVLSSKTALKTSEMITNEFKKGINIPTLAFSGIKIFSGYGKDVSYKSLEVNSTKSEIISKFESTGINQTLHSIYLQVETVIDFYIPLNEKQVKTNNTVLLCESVLVGKIPDVYLNGKIGNI